MKRSFTFTAVFRTKTHPLTYVFYILIAKYDTTKNMTSVQQDPTRPLATGM